MLIGKKLKRKRLSKGYSQQQLADLYSATNPEKSISRFTVQRWESDRLKPDIDDIETLTKIYKCSMPRLMDIKIDVPARHYLAYKRLTTDEKKIHEIMLNEFNGDYDALVHSNGMYFCLPPKSRRKVIRTLIQEYEYCKKCNRLVRKMPVSELYVQKAYDKLLKYAKYED